MELEILLIGIKSIMEWSDDSKMRKIGVVGLGYVGLPLAVAFGEEQPIIGFDINHGRIEELRQGFDRTKEISNEKLKHAKIEFTENPASLHFCDFIIVAVPTPVNEAKIPDLEPLIAASRTVGKILSKGTIVVYESTVYPGATEEICLPILEKESGLHEGVDFSLGYSPERINPGDKLHSLRDIKKIVSARNRQALDVVAEVYGQVVRAGLHKTTSIMVAESAKVIENTQRDLNIALMNELSIIFSKLGIDTREVLEAAGTKWNFLNFTPGLVGGHCIGVDPYYLTYKAEQVGYHPQVILAGRRINDGMGQFIATTLVKQLILNGVSVQGSKVAVLGLSFKEDIPDLRNSKVFDLIKELKEFGIQVQVCDPIASPLEAELYGIPLIPFESLDVSNAVVLAVAHNLFREMGWHSIGSKLCSRGILIDVKASLPKNECPDHVTYWRL
jgi:UDP-N-acetyl-D-glucosamine/UDP-N-acetyl-D-galactosamine dehydrogenase